VGVKSIVAVENYVRRLFGRHGVRVYLYKRVVAAAMTDDEEPVQQCTLDTAVDIPKALEAAAIEYLDVDEHRTIVIYQSAILMITATEGQATAARAFDVALWEPPVEDFDRDPVDLLTAFIDELVATTGASRR
jgi:hypothetical protein